MTMLTDLLHRLLRTESLATIAGLVFYLTGRVETMEEAVALGAIVAPIVLGRSYAKRGSMLP